MLSRSDSYLAGPQLFSYTVARLNQIYFAMGISLASIDADLSLGLESILPAKWVLFSSFIANTNKREVGHLFIVSTSIHALSKLYPFFVRWPYNYFCYLSDDTVQLFLSVSNWAHKMLLLSSHQLHLYNNADGDTVQGFIIDDLHTACPNIWAWLTSDKNLIWMHLKSTAIK